MSAALAIALSPTDDSAHPANVVPKVTVILGAATVEVEVAGTIAAVLKASLYLGVVDIYNVLGEICV